MKDTKTGTTSNAIHVARQKLTLEELIQHASTYSGVKSEDLKILINDKAVEESTLEFELNKNASTTFTFAKKLDFKAIVFC